MNKCVYHLEGQLKQDEQSAWQMRPPDTEEDDCNVKLERSQCNKLASYGID